MDQHLINTLHEGLHSDNDQNAQPPNSYRDAMNGTIVTLGGNRYSFESLKGNTVSFTVPDHYNLKPFQPIGWYSFIDALIVLLASDEASSTPGEIAKVTFNNDGTLDTYTPLYYHTGLNFSKNYPIPHDGIVGKPENANIKRVVWTDNNSPLRTMNWADSRFTTIIESGTLVNGSKYMVLTKDASSYITYGGVDYAPGRAGGNIFTATATTTYTTTGSNVWVIEYVPIESFDVSPDFAPGSVLFKGVLQGGSLAEGDYQYAYQLETSDGARTSWSYLSLPMSIVGDNIPSSQSISYAKHLSNGATDSTKGIKLTIDNIDNTTYSRIRVCFVQKTGYGIYNDPEVFYYASITGVSMDIEHYGNETAYEIISLDSLTTPNLSLDLVKSISSAKNILFAANIGLAADPEIDLSAVEAKSFDYLMPGDILGGNPSSTSGFQIDDGYAIHGFGMVQNESVGQQYALPHQWHEVISGSVTYNGVSYSAGQFFMAIPGTTAITGSGKCVAVIRIQKYTSASTLADGNYRSIRIEEEFCNYKGAIPAHYIRSYWREETYRFGVLFYGKKGQQNYVQFLIDKTLPSQYDDYTDTEVIDNVGGTDAIGYDPKLCEYGSATAVSLRALGMRFSNIDFQEVADAYGVDLADLDTVVKGFSIVRVERDPQIIAQGVLCPNVITSTGETDICSASSVDNDKEGTLNGRRLNSYMYYSPDNQSLYEDRPTKQGGDYLRIADYYDPVSGIDTGWLAVSDNNYYEKYYAQATETSGPIYSKGSEIAIAVEGTELMEHAAEGIAISGLTGSIFNNRGTCASFYDNGGGGIGERVAYGCDGVHVLSSVTETGTTSDGIGDMDAGEQHRVIASWVRPKSNLYGGNSDLVKANHRYIFCGHYQALDSAFMTYMTGTTDNHPAITDSTYYPQGRILTDSGTNYICILTYTSGSPATAPSSDATHWSSIGAAGKTAGIVNNVEVFGGDAFISMFGFGRCYRYQGGGSPTMSQGMVIPIESNINENWRGANRNMNKDRFYDLNEAPNGISHEPSPNIGLEESWQIYDQLTGPELQYFFLARPFRFQGVNRDEHLVAYSLEKVDGEISDNWRVFLPQNYKRVDGQYGAITNIVAKSSRLFYLQNKGVGYLPVFERQLQDSSLGDAIQLGIGGILERFDEIDYEIGNQHQMGLMVGQDAMVWFDWRRKLMMRLSFGGGKEPLSLVKGLDAFFHNKFTEVESETGSTIFNSENPLTGKGILSYYDHRMKMGMMCFKYSQTSGSRTIEKDFTVLFNHLLNKFVGFSSIAPNHIIEHNGHLLMTREVRPAIVGSTSYVVGDEVTDATDYHNYICITAFTSGGSPTQPRSDSANWVKASQINQIYVNWRGDYCKFFGKVHEFYLSAILKNSDLMKLAIDNIEVGGNNTIFTDVYVDNSYQSGSDTDIVTTNKNYDYVDGSWWFNLPFASNGARLADSWMQVKMRVKNYVTDPTTSTNLVKRIFYIKSSIRKKR